MVCEMGVVVNDCGSSLQIVAKSCARMEPAALRLYARLTPATTIRSPQHRPQQCLAISRPAPSPSQARVITRAARCPLTHPPLLHDVLKELAA